MNKLLVGAFASAFAVVPVTAAAQQSPSPSPPTLPQNPTSPLDFPAGLRPAAPPSTGAAGATGTATPTAPPDGYQGGDMTTTGANESLYRDVRDPVRRYQGRTLPDFHDVKGGDTLWSIASYYYGDPWVWPKLWSQNKSITNPHWIYPGDRIALFSPGSRTPGQRRGRGEEVISDVVIRGQRRYGVAPVKLERRAFADPRELGKAGSVVGAVAGRSMLSTFDDIYIKGGKGFDVKVGRTYTAYRVVRPLKNGDGKLLGHVVEVGGSVKVKSISPKGIARATIMDVVSPIERGHRIGPLRRVAKTVAARPATKSLEGRLIGALNPRAFYTVSDFVYIDRGTRQGVRVGNRFLVVRRADGFRRIIQMNHSHNPSYPVEATAEILVTDARPETCVGVITRATTEVQIPAAVYLKRGY